MVEFDFSGFAGKNILVVGGAGFVGSNLVRMLLKLNTDLHITVVDNFMSAEPENLPQHPLLNVIIGSISEESVLSKINDVYQYIFHLATYHGNQSSIHDPLADHAHNTYTTLRLLNHIKDFENIIKLVYSSAGCSVAKKTFEDAEETTEDAPLEIRQDSPYSISKIIGEFYSVYFHKQHSVPTVRARFQNVYGPGEILGAGQWRGTPATIWRNVTPTFIYKSLKNMPMPLENEGIATRDFIFVEDICRGLMLCALRGEPGDVYNIGSGVETSIRLLAETINSITGNAAGIKLLPRRSWDTSGKRFASIAKSKEKLRFEAQVDLKTGLSITINWTQENLHFIEQTMHKHSAQLKYSIWL